MIGYNGFMRLIKKHPAVGLGLICLFVLSAFAMPAPQGAPTGYDLVVAVNEYRASQGYYPLNPNNLVTSAAQAHADWIVATGQGGHIGLNGSDETVRVSWTGYGGGAAIRCDENWASARSIEQAIYQAWSDWTHQEVMLNAWGNRYTDAGGGVAARGDGGYVFVLNVCLVVGKSASGSVPGANPNPLATADWSNYVYGVTTATPQPDGKIIHTVLYGQTLLGIAEAYGVTVDELRTLNGMAANETIIWPDQELLIKTGTGIAAEASPAATGEVLPSPTIMAVTPSVDTTPTMNPTLVPTPNKTSMRSVPLITTIGLVLAGLVGTGLVLIFVSSIQQKKG